MRWSCSKALLCLTMGIAAVTANAGGLTFTRSDIVDMVPGEDLWQNTYSFTGALEAFGGLTLTYSPSTYGRLDVEAAVKHLVRVAVAQRTKLDVADDEALERHRLRHHHSLGPCRGQFLC